MAQVIDFPKGLTFHKDQVQSQFVKDLKKIFRNINVSYVDLCCGEVPTTSAPLRFNTVTGQPEFNNGTNWVAASDKGTVTQATSKTTSVTLNKHSGVITTVALTDAADTSFQFTLTNSVITTASVINLTALNSGNGVAVLSLVSVSNGSAVIKVTNAGTAAFNSLIKIHFTVS